LKLLVILPFSQYWFYVSTNMEGLSNFTESKDLLSDLRDFFLWNL
jgi:hypothetical protein